jgi:hypothetical protein
LGDEEARRRGTQKTVLERKAPPTFDVLVEQEERHLVGVHHDVAVAVDALLRGEAPLREMRERQPDGTIRRWTERAPGAARADGVGLPTREAPVVREELPARRPARTQGRRGSLAGSTLGTPWWRDPATLSGRAGAPASHGTAQPGARWLDPELAGDQPDDGRTGNTSAADDGATLSESPPAFRKRRLYAMGVNRNHLEQAIHELGLPAIVTRDDREADAVLVLKTLYRRQIDRVNAFEQWGIPVYVLRSASVERLREALADLYRGDIERRQARQDVTSLASDGDASQPPE